MSANQVRRMTFLELARSDPKEAIAIAFFAPAFGQNSPNWKQGLFDRTTVEWSVKNCRLCHNRMFVSGRIKAKGMTRLRCTCGRSVDAVEDDMANEKQPSL